MIRKYCLLTIMVAFAFLFVGCKKKKCETKTDTVVRSVNFYETKSTSPYYNKVVVIFRFTQTSNTYSGDECPSMNCGTTLKIQNNTSKKLTFDYDILYWVNKIGWKYQGVAVLPANGTLDVGQINRDCDNITLGSFIIEANPTYE